MFTKLCERFDCKKWLSVIGVVVVIVVIAVAISSLFKHGDNKDSIYYTLERGPLTRSVEFSGTIVPKSRVELAFDRTGRVTNVLASTGDNVVSGQVLARLDSGDAGTNLEREQALLDIEETKLTELMQGARSEEVDVERAQVSQYEAQLADARVALMTNLINSYAIAESAVHTTADELFDNPSSVVPKVKYTTSQRSLELMIENERSSLEYLLDDWNQSTQDIGISKTDDDTLMSMFRKAIFMAASVEALPTEVQEEDFSQYVTEARNNLARVKLYIDNVLLYTNNLNTTNGLTQTTIDAWQVALQAERVNLQTGISSLNTAYEKFRNSQQTVKVGHRRLDLLIADPTPESIALQKAQISAQKVRVHAMQNELSEYSLRAPFTGSIIADDIEVGELVLSGTPVFTVDAVGNFEMDAHVSELEVAYLTIGAPADVVLDAYGENLILSANVSHIDPAETDVNGVAGYGVTLTLSDQDEKLRAGMTSNARILLTLSEDTLSVPVGYIKRDGGAYMVQLATPNRDEVEERTVVVGPQVADGMIEILSGLEEGDTIKLYEE